jgi:carbon-monoxide dehydrogenase medium subunit
MTMVRSHGKFKYQTPGSLPEVLKILETSILTRKVLAGGTDLVLQMKQGIVRPSLGVDINQVPE